MPVNFTNTSFDFVAVATNSRGQENFVLSRNDSKDVPSPMGSRLLYAWRIGRYDLTGAEQQQYSVPVDDGAAIIFGTDPEPDGQVP